MIESLDENVGKLMDYLEKNKLTENTLVIFCSDNGGTKNVGSNAPFSGFKGQLYEGGHRVPAIFNWKDRIPTGDSDELVLSMDLFPTIASLMGLEIPQELSGKDISKIFNWSSSEKSEKDRIVFWRFQDQWAVRKGNWKLLMINGGASLFNLDNDIQELNDVKETFPEIYHELTNEYVKWESDLKEKTKCS